MKQVFSTILCHIQPSRYGIVNETSAKASTILYHIQSSRYGVVSEQAFSTILYHILADRYSIVNKTSSKNKHARAIEESQGHVRSVQRFEINSWSIEAVAVSETSSPEDVPDSQKAEVRINKL